MTPDDVTVINGDTARIGQGIGTFASRAAVGAQGQEGKEHNHVFSATTVMLDSVSSSSRCCFGGSRSLRSQSLPPGTFRSPGNHDWGTMGREPSMGLTSGQILGTLEQNAPAIRRHGVRSLLVAKFIPGLNAVAPPLAGIFGVTLVRFVLYDGLGALFWAESFVGLGYLFSNQLERVAAHAARLGSMLLILLVGTVAVNILYWNRSLLLLLGQPAYPNWVQLWAGLLKIAATVVFVPLTGAVGMAVLLSAYFTTTTAVLVARTGQLLRRAESGA